MKLPFKTAAIATLALRAVFTCAVGTSPALASPPPQSPAASSELQKKAELYLRNNFALGPDFQIEVGSPKELGTSGLLEMHVDIKYPDGSSNLKIYISRDGRYIVTGEVSDLNVDPLAENSRRIKTANAPVMGNPNATITIVEFSDFECPVCRNLHDTIRALLPNYPQVKVVFKDFPLESLHPWARTAALAGRCAYHQDPKTFWKLYDLIYDNQEIISAGNAYDKMVEFAGRFGLQIDAFKTCLASPEAAKEVDASIANGTELDVRSTPTVYINGRLLVGGDPHTFQRYLDYEIALQKFGKK